MRLRQNTTTVFASFGILEWFHLCVSRYPLQKVVQYFDMTTSAVNRRKSGARLHGWRLALLVFCAFFTKSCGQEKLDAKDLTLDELVETFGTQDHKKAPDHLLFIPKVDHHSDGSIKHLWLNSSELGSFGHELSEALAFTPSSSSLLSSELTVVQRYGNYSTLQIHSTAQNRNCHFQSTNEQVLAAVSNCDGNLKGVILKPSGTFVIHPAPERHQKLQKRDVSSQGYGLHVIYKRETESATEIHSFCDMEEGPEQDEEEEFKIEDAFVISDWTQIQSRLSKRDEMTIELALFLDEDLWTKFYNKYGGYAESKLQDFVITIFNNIQLLYQSPSISPKISFKIVHYEVFKRQPADLHTTYHSNGNAQQYLDVFCKYQARRRGRDRWDHAFLMSGLNLHKGYRSNSISGIARLHGMCDHGNTCTLTEGLDFTSVFIGTHEMGHSVGMRHDEPYCDSSHIMSSSLGPGKVTWSSCSMRDYQKFMNRLDRRGKNCLKYSRRDEVVNRDQTLPGQKYSADQQCEMMHGYGYKQVTPNQDYEEGLCHMMWCGQNGFGRIITSHPALEGTFCGHNLWCLEGKCVQWSSLPSVQPTQVDGGWSSWGSVTCAQCSCPPFPDGVGILNSRRTCSNPSPRNGGRECEGANVRGIVCSRDCAGRTDSVKEYTGRICEAHRVSRNDHDLTGKGAQLLKYSSRACKVFCIIRSPRGSSRNYRFLGDFLPDGTDCGWNSYCVGGKCLRLSCEEKAVAAANYDCPSADEMCRITQPVAAAVVPVSATQSQWRAWNTWTACSVSCGSGYRTRVRQCDVGTDGSRCRGESSESSSCLAGFCPWTTWSGCSKSCDGGTQTRSRYCPGGGCRGTGEQRRDCNTNSCIIWSTWGTWTACSQTCGAAQRKRSRNCSGPDCAAYPNRIDEQVEDCARKFCSWESWSRCSVTCSQGSRERYRKCPGGGCFGDPWDTVGGHKEVQNCDMGYCYVSEWTDWSSWTACSTTCGSGRAARYRSCQSKDGEKNQAHVTPTCPGKADEKRECSEKPCGYWSSWSTWSLCSRTCGGGTRNRKRRCVEGRDCKGESEQTGKCGSQTSCSASFNDKQDGIWSSWAPWGQCSSNCGTGIRSRHRTCDQGRCTGDAMEKVECKEPCGSWSRWSRWSACSRTCGGLGKRSRNRSCIGGSDCIPGPTREMEPCGSDRECPPQVRRRPQQNFRKSMWSGWSGWSVCSSSCGHGTQRRHRTCVKGSCDGPSIGTQPCHGNRCPGEWTSWGDWSECSKSCGTGNQYRERSCPNGGCNGAEGGRQAGQCNLNPCSGIEDQGRPVEYNGRAGFGNWGSWGMWSMCSTSCDLGVQTRVRNCYSEGHCSGPSAEKLPCQYNPCAQWGGWGMWSACSNSCGGGVMKRVRNCYGTGVCGGENIQSGACAKQQCTDIKR